jgi:hypothetical protein
MQMVPVGNVLILLPTDLWYSIGHVQLIKYDVTHQHEKTSGVLMNELEATGLVLEYRTYAL